MRANKRGQQGSVNAGSMADIAFLLLIFFLVTTNILQDQGLLVRLPVWDDPSTRLLTLNEDKVFSVKINALDELLVEKEASALSDLATQLQAFLQNEQYPANEKLVSLVHDRSSSYERYVAVYDALISTYKAVRNQQALQQYGKAYDFISSEAQTAIRRQIPMIISEAEPSDFGKNEEG